MKQLFIIPLILISSFAFSQTKCPCCTDNHFAFDFWVGDWVVKDTLGKPLGENSINKLENNCIINEHWKGAGGGTGSSYNYFDSKDSTWNQLWIDNSGSILKLKGKAEPNKMILKSELQPGKKIDWYYNQITWTKREDGTVSQVWDIFDKDGNLLNTIFYGIYHPKE